MAFSSCGSRLYALSRCPVEGKDLQHDFLSRDDSPPKKGVNLLKWLEKQDLSKKSLLNLKLCDVTFKSLTIFGTRSRILNHHGAGQPPRSSPFFRWKLGSYCQAWTSTYSKEFETVTWKKWQVMASPSLNWKPQVASCSCRCVSTKSVCSQGTRRHELTNLWGSLCVLVILMGFFVCFLNKFVARSSKEGPAEILLDNASFAGPPGSGQKFHCACCFHHQVLWDLHFEASVRDLSDHTTWKQVTHSLLEVSTSNDSKT